MAGDFEVARETLGQTNTPTDICALKLSLWMLMLQMNVDHLMWNGSEMAEWWPIKIPLSKMWLDSSRWMRDANYQNMFRISWTKSLTIFPWCNLARRKKRPKDECYETHAFLKWPKNNFQRVQFSDVQLYSCISEIAFFIFGLGVNFFLSYEAMSL